MLQAVAGRDFRSWTSITDRLAYMYCFIWHFGSLALQCLCPAKVWLCTQLVVMLWTIGGDDRVPRHGFQQNSERLHVIEGVCSILWANARHGWQYVHIYSYRLEELIRRLHTWFHNSICSVSVCVCVLSLSVGRHVSPPSLDCLIVGPLTFIFNGMKTNKT